MRLEPDASTRLELARLLHQLGRFSETAVQYRAVLTTKPDSLEALNNLAVALEQQGDFDKAREAYEKALKLKPGSVYIQQNFDLFREADDKRNRKARKKRAPQTQTQTPTQTPAPTPTQP